MLQKWPLRRPGYRFTILAAAVQQQERLPVRGPYVAGGTSEARIVTRSNRLAVGITGAQVLH